jgi:hypothetical protein
MLLKDRDQSAAARIRIQLKGDPISNDAENEFVFDQKFHLTSTIASQPH